MAEGFPVQKVAAKVNKGGVLKTSNYFGPHSLGVPKDIGAKRHGHVDVDEEGNVIFQRDVGEKMPRQRRRKVKTRRRSASDPEKK